MKNMHVGSLSRTHRATRMIVGAVAVGASLAWTSPAPGRVFVLPHVLEKSGLVSGGGFTFDTTIFATYSGALNGAGGGSGGATLYLTLIDEATGRPLLSGTGVEVANRLPLGISAAHRKESYRLDDFITN